MKTYLLPRDAVYYKANLHCHTTLFDGKKTPEEIKRDYMAHGYSAVAFTDHDKYYCHDDLTDGSFVALNGFELEYYAQPWRGKTCHLCFIAKRPGDAAFGWSSPEPPIFIRSLPEGALDPAEGGQLYRVTCPGRKYNADYINAEIAAGKDMGFFVTYNHPTWSLERYPDYSAYRGMDAMEIANYGCLAEGYDDDNGRPYEDLISLGNRLFCIAADDNHNEHPDSTAASDSYGAYVMLAAEGLNYASLISALQQGRFYSCGRVNPGAGECPGIRNLWLQDGTVHIETTEAANIALIRDTRPFRMKIAEAGEPLTEAEFPLGECKWFRLAVTGMNGCKAWTNAFFTAELGQSRG